MIYNEFSGKKLSALGLGCMRLPLNSENDSDINISLTKEMVDYAIKNGINYFDTAWGYHEGKSETVMGEVLKQYPRESFYLASKFPGYDTENMSKVEEIFEEQLKKCQVDYFDFYLFHCLSERNIDLYLNPKYGIMDYLLKQKANGRIRHIGLSVHSEFETLKRFLDAYGEHMEFCQLQINWVDWGFEKVKVEYLSKLNIPIWVMEPVRGGSLINLKPTFQKRLDALDPKVKNAEWAFRFIQSIPEVKMTLSGMSNLNQLKENIKTFSAIKPLNDFQKETLLKTGRDMTNSEALPCTACSYCVAKCPKQINIPLFTEQYNEFIYSGEDYKLPKEILDLDRDNLPSACIACRACEAVCPQNIKVSDMMSAFSEKLL